MIQNEAVEEVSAFEDTFENQPKVAKGFDTNKIKWQVGQWVDFEHQGGRWKEG